jgi:peptidoglycan/LPS O-acetylase OafA/YrhL
MVRLQRITTSGRWIPEIDGLRFVAIMAVILIHCANPILLDIHFQSIINQPGVKHFIALLYHLNRGVPLFFAISGYIIAQPFLRQYTGLGTAVSLKSFYLRRVTRLEPPYILSLVIYGIALWLFGNAKHTGTWHSVLLSLVYIHNFFRHPRFVNPPTWSLEVEIQFYLIAPALGLIYRVRSVVWRRLALIVCLVISTLWPVDAASKVGFFLPTYFCFFLVGMLLAEFRIESPDLSKHVLWDVAAPLLWIAFLLLSDSAPSLLFCAILFLAIVASMRGPTTARLLSIQWITLLGGMCYSIYLLHILVIHSLYPIVRHALIFPSFYVNYIIEVLLLTGPVLLVSMTFFILVERPCMDKNWPQKLGNVLRLSQTSRNGKVSLTPS